MTARSFVTKLLKFKGFCTVSHWWENREREFVVAVKPYKNGCRCPECDRRGKIVHTAKKPRRWRDVRVCGQTVYLSYRPREILCPAHGRVQEAIPWAAPSAQVSYRYDYVLLRMCAEMPQSVVAEHLGVPTSTLSDQLHRAIERGRQGHKIRDLKTIGIDEISYARGHKYATVVYDLERSCVVWIGDGKGRETIDRFFEEVLSDYQKSKIKWACCDISEAYIGAIKDHCKNVKLVLDRFHIVKKLNEAVDEVRKEQWREANGKEGKAQRQALKGLRWLLLRHSVTRTRKDTKTLKELEKWNRRIYRAWRLKDEFEQFWEYNRSSAAANFLESWTATAMRSRLDPIKHFVKTLRNHSEDILAFIDTRLTNAVSEGLNRIIRMIKNRASGFRTLDAFSDLIFLCVGDVNIADQIPMRFRTL
jgi:transposase